MKRGHLVGAALCLAVGGLIYLEAWRPTNVDLPVLAAAARRQETQFVAPLSGTHELELWITRQTSPYTDTCLLNLARFDRKPETCPEEMKPAAGRWSIYHGPDLVWSGSAEGLADGGYGREVARLLGKAQLRRGRTYRLVVEGFALDTSIETARPHIMIVYTYGSGAARLLLLLLGLLLSAVGFLTYAILALLSLRRPLRAK